MRVNPFDKLNQPAEIELTDIDLETLEGGVDPAQILMEVEEEALDYLNDHGESTNVYTLRWAVNLLMSRRI